MAAPKKPMRFEVKKLQPESADGGEPGLGSVADLAACQRRRGSAPPGPPSPRVARVPSLAGSTEYSGSWGEGVGSQKRAVARGNGNVVAPQWKAKLPEIVISEEGEEGRGRQELSPLLDEKGSVSPSALAPDDADVPWSKVTPEVARFGREYARRQKRRLIFKDGTCNVSSKNVTERKKRYLVDLFTTFVDMRWRYNLVMFGAAFVGSWFVFSIIWLTVAVAHGDHLETNDTEWIPCVGGVSNFHTALLFSIETQHTIGYGSRAIESECPHAVLVLMLQSCVGVFIQSLMTGLLFAKLSRPKGRAQTLIFSQKAVVCQRDGEYCLLFRLGDMRKSHIISTSIRALIVKNRLTREGESIPLCQYTLGLETETNFSDGFVFLVWPVTVVHRIDATSPLWEMSAESLLSEHFEIVVILEGILESTGMTTQFRTSYLPTEILWGQRLTPLFTYQRTNGQYEIDFKSFHNAIPVDSMPVCSAKEYHELHSADASATKEKYFPVNFTAQTVAPRHWSTLRRKILRNRPQSVSVIAPSKVMEGSNSTPGGRNRARTLSRQESLQAHNTKDIPVTPVSPVAKKYKSAAEKSKEAETNSEKAFKRSRSESEAAELMSLLTPSSSGSGSADGGKDGEGGKDKLDLANGAVPSVNVTNGKRANLYAAAETTSSRS